jgi:hypothetical protein
MRDESYVENRRRSHQIHRGFIAACFYESRQLQKGEWEEMMDPNWSLAHVEEARAYYFADHVLLTITGQKPDPCHIVDIEKSLLTVEPPGFIARWYAYPGFCPEVITPYAYQEVFFIGMKRETVKLYHADGDVEVEVQDLTQELEAGSARAELVLGGQPGEATGYSNAFDFTEAFRDAIDKLSDQGPGIQDWLYTYEVTSIGAEIGGIAGFNHMYVKVRG